MFPLSASNQEDGVRVVSVKRGLPEDTEMKPFKAMKREPEGERGIVESMCLD